jgi:hypothetical protein
MGNKKDTTTSSLGTKNQGIDKQQQGQSPGQNYGSDTRAGKTNQSGMDTDRGSRSTPDSERKGADTYKNRAQRDQSSNDDV